MKFFDKITKKFTSSASTAVKKEVKETIVDILPGLIGTVGVVAAILIFKDAKMAESVLPVPRACTTTIMTNNYFFHEMSEEMIKQIIERSIVK